MNYQHGVFLATFSCLKFVSRTNRKWQYWDYYLSKRNSKSFVQGWEKRKLPNPIHFLQPH